MAEAEQLRGAAERALPAPGAARGPAGARARSLPRLEHVPHLQQAAGGSPARPPRVGAWFPPGPWGTGGSSRDPSLDLFLGVGMEDAGGRSHVSQDGLKRYSQRRPSTSDPLASTFPSVVISVMQRHAPVYGVLGIKPRTVRFCEST